MAKVVGVNFPAINSFHSRRFVTAWLVAAWLIPQPCLVHLPRDVPSDHFGVQWPL